MLVRATRGLYYQLWSGGNPGPEVPIEGGHSVSFYTWRQYTDEDAFEGAAGGTIWVRGLDTLITLVDLVTANHWSNYDLLAKFTLGNDLKQLRFREVAFGLGQWFESPVALFTSEQRPEKIDAELVCVPFKVLYSFDDYPPDDVFGSRIFLENG
ncbi:MAG TPA: hypothetical protein VMX97_18045 [Hyphomicrobiaceae bacterium]|nr:hypothetical protein [Hyphomicrobiaceae bacterium]